MTNFEIIIASPPDRNNLVAEIWHEENLLAEVNQETDNFEIEFYLNNTKKFNLNELMIVLDSAINKLKNGG